jgi:hypothetical protein
MKNLLKRLTIIVVVILASNFSYGQGLQPNNLFGVHVITVNLNPNVTMDEFKTFFVHEVIPEYEKHWPGLRGYLVKSARGEYQNRFAVVWLFKTVADRDRNFDADDKPNELENAALEQVKPIEEKLKHKYGTYTVKYMDDWVVQ